MTITLSHISAFRFHRTPPQVLELLPGLERVSSAAGRKELMKVPEAAGGIGFPLHTLVHERNHRQNGKLLTTHLRTFEYMPIGAIQNTDFGFSVTSPLFTLLLMAPRMHIVDLAMMLMEVCGTFSVYRPSTQVNQLLRQDFLEGANFEYWERASNSSGETSDLWTRNPLVSNDELFRFIEDTRGLRGNVKLARAAQWIHGTVASPFEARSSLKVELPRRMGGAGIPITENNRRIQLSHPARRLANRDSCVADIFIESPDRKEHMDIECQSKFIHGHADAFLSDAERTASLQSMGIQVMPLTYKTLVNPRSFHAFIETVERQLGIPIRKKTPWMKDRERELDRLLFMDWNKLGSWEIPYRRHK